MLRKIHQEKQLNDFLLRGDLLRKSLPYLEADLLSRLYSELQGTRANKPLHAALEQECSDIETLIEAIRAQTMKADGIQAEAPSMLEAIKEAVEWIEDDRFDDDYITEEWYQKMKNILSKLEEVC